MSDREKRKQLVRRLIYVSFAVVMILVLTTLIIGRLPLPAP